MGETVGVVIWRDRHSDTGVYVFERTDTAIEWAKGQARTMSRGRELDENLTEGMRQGGWLYYGCYSCEADYLRVEEQTIRKE